MKKGVKVQVTGNPVGQNPVVSVHEEATASTNGSTTSSFKVRVEGYSGPINIEIGEVEGQQQQESTTPEAATSTEGQASPSQTNLEARIKELNDNVTALRLAKEAPASPKEKLVRFLEEEKTRISRMIDGLNQPSNLNQPEAKQPLVATVEGARKEANPESSIQSATRDEEETNWRKLLFWAAAILLLLLLLLGGYWGYRAIKARYEAKQATALPVVVTPEPQTAVPVLPPVQPWQDSVATALERGLLHRGQHGANIHSDYRVSNLQLVDAFDESEIAPLLDAIQSPHLVEVKRENNRSIYSYLVQTDKDHKYYFFFYPHNLSDSGGTGKLESIVYGKRKILLAYDYRTLAKR